MITVLQRMLMDLNCPDLPWEVKHEEARLTVGPAHFILTWADFGFIYESNPIIVVREAAMNPDCYQLLADLRFKLLTPQGRMKSFETCADLLSAEVHKLCWGK